MPYGLDIVNQAHQDYQNRQREGSETQPSGAYNFYDWKTYDDKQDQNLMNVYRNAGRLGNQLSDFSSPFYQQYASYLSKALPATGLNSYLSILQSGGGNYAGSMSQAMQLKGNEDKKRRDAINTGVQGFAANNVNMLGQLLGIQAGAGSNILQARTQKEISSDQQGGALDFLGSVVGTVGGALLAPATMGASLIPTFASMFGGGGGMNQQQMANYQQMYNQFGGG